MSERDSSSDSEAPSSLSNSTAAEEALHQLRRERDQGRSVVEAVKEERRRRKHLFVNKEKQQRQLPQEVIDSLVEEEENESKAEVVQKRAKSQISGGKDVLADSGVDVVLVNDHPRSLNPMNDVAVRGVRARGRAALKRESQENVLRREQKMRHIKLLKHAKKS